MNTSSRRFATYLAVGISVLVGFIPSAAGAALRPRTQYAGATAVGHASGPAPRLSYYGGRVLSHVKVDLVVWDRWSYGRTVPLSGRRSMSSFFSGITASKYLDWLSEYDTPT